jgi:hypothetical protein
MGKLAAALLEQDGVEPVSEEPMTNRGISWQTKI